jgi:hypothetical protein
MLRRIEQVADTLSFSASGSSTINLPRTGYITRIHCVLLLNITPAAGTATAATDGFVKVVNSARVHSSGTDYFNVGDGRDWYWMSYYQNRGQIRLGTLPSAGGAAADVYGDFVIHLGTVPEMTPQAWESWDRVRTRRRDGTRVTRWRQRSNRSRIGGPFDKTVVIPAIRLSDPQLTVTWNTQSSLGTGFTINSGTMYAFIYELIPEPRLGETQGKIWKNGLIVPRIYSTTEALDSANTAKGLHHEVPTQMVLRQSLLQVLDGSGDRSDTPVTELGVENTADNETMLDGDWHQLKGENRFRTGVAATNAGIYFIDWSLLSGDEWGLDLKDVRPGTVEVQMSNAATASGVARFLHYGYVKEK